MTVLRELVTVLGFKTDDAGAKRGALVFAGLVAGAVALKKATTAAVSVISEIVKETAAFGDETAKTSAAISINAQALQELQFAAQLAGLTVNETSTALRFLSRNLGDADQGLKRPIDTFKQLGISIKDSNGELKASEDVLEEVADKFKNLRDDGNKTALAINLFGRSGARMAILLSQGAEGIRQAREEARAFGGILDTEALKQTEQFQDEVLRLDTVIDSLRRNLGVKLIPIISDLITKFREFLFRNRELINDGIDKLVESIKFGLDTLKALVRVIRENSTFLKIFAGIISIAFLPAMARATAAVVLFGLKAAAAGFLALLPWIPFLIIAVLIAAAIEDVIIHLEGGDSALGALVDHFTTAAEDVDSFWMTRSIAFFLTMIKDAIESLDEFFKIWFEQARQGEGLIDGLVRTIKMAGEGLVLFFTDIAQAIFDGITRKAKEAFGDLPIPDVLLRLAGPGSAVDNLFANPANDPAGPAPAATGGGGVSIGDRNLSISISGAGVGDEEALVSRFRTEAEKILEDDRRITLDALQSQVAR